MALRVEEVDVVEVHAAVDESEHHTPALVGLRQVVPEVDGVDTAFGPCAVVGEREGLRHGHAAHTGCGGHLRQDGQRHPGSGQRAEARLDGGSGGLQAREGGRVGHLHVGR